MVGRRVGLVQLCNILGNTAGAVVTGLVLLHWLGTALTLRLIGVVSLAFVLVALTGRTWIRSRGPKPIVLRRNEGALGLGLLALLALFPSNGRFWSALHGTSLAEGAIVFEDRTGVAVLRAAEPRMQAIRVYGDRIGPEYDTLFIGSHARAGALHPETRRARGCGCGASSRPTRHPDHRQGAGGTPIAAGVNQNTTCACGRSLICVRRDTERPSAGSGHPSRAIGAHHWIHALLRSRGCVRAFAEDIRRDIIRPTRYIQTRLSGKLYSIEFSVGDESVETGGYGVQDADRADARELPAGVPYVVAPSSC